MERRPATLLLRVSLDLLLAPSAPPTGAVVRLRDREVAGSGSGVRRAVPPAIQALVVVLAPEVPGEVTEGAAAPVGSILVL